MPTAAAMAAAAVSARLSAVAPAAKVSSLTWLYFFLGSFYVVVYFVMDACMLL